MDYSGKEKEAMAIVAEADKKTKTSHSMFGAFFGSSSKIEEACDMYVRAANMFKMAKNWSAAGDAFCKAARLYLQVQSKHNAAVSFIDAGNAYKKADPQEAISCFCKVTDIYTDMGRFNIAAKHHISIAEIYESELLDIDKNTKEDILKNVSDEQQRYPLTCIGVVSVQYGIPTFFKISSFVSRRSKEVIQAVAHYEQAADYYKGEESTSAANKCLLKVATYAAQMEQYEKAIEIYEQIGTYSMDTTLLKYAAKDYFFKAALCHFCVDMLNCKLAVQKYENMYPAFADARECKLVKKLLDAHEDQNIDAYTEAIREFDSITRLDQWQTTMLLRIKKTIQDEESDLR